MGASGPREPSWTSRWTARPLSCDLQYWRPTAGSPEALHCAWLTLQALASLPQRGTTVSLILSLFNSLLLDPKAFNLGKALVALPQSSCREPDGGGKRALHMEIWEDSSSPHLGSFQPWAGLLVLAGTGGTAQWVGLHTMAADLGPLSRAGSSRKGGTFRLVQLCWHLGLAGVRGCGHFGGVSGCRTLGLPTLVSGLV